tara:strand:- start:454 stop:963 length:510 start_codon:yes stop_codon:yes gene_type:complete
MKIPKNFLIDVDGVLNTGQFIYNKNGKFGKIFGPDDNDALKILSEFINIQFISSDKRGFQISKKRIALDMGFKLKYIENKKRIKWIGDNFDLKKTIYMGDGIFDWILMKSIFFSISCSDSNNLARKYSKYITKAKSGNRAVSEACFFILKKFFVKRNIEKTIIKYLNKK